MLPISGLREEETCYISVVSEERNLLPISGLGEEEACYIAVISEERKHVTFQWSPRRGTTLPISVIGNRFISSETTDM
jgi:hypothetical protein